MSKRKIPKYLSLVKFDFDGLPKRDHKNFPFKKERPYVFFGEISNMRGHCVVADHKTGRIYSGYHTYNFVELSKDET